ncbi:hypothetical protein THTE_2450 [Thermogutta terrifontis]|uniref:Uncharacterized protein n=1 Tax=Thermogutta terrifontis TaxID=1331910 RepID=A0A286RGJ1_9BACT|nr:hypothetical protein THTE_2450 [Thermogutta terrifontis]
MERDLTSGFLEEILRRGTLIVPDELELGQPRFTSAPEK